MPTLDAILQHRPQWLVPTSAGGSIAVSTRVRLARNVAELPFPHRCSNAQRRSVIERVHAAARTTSALRDARLYPLDTLGPLDRQVLVERHLVSPEFIAQDRAAALLVAADQSCAVMINEEDHLRMQVLREDLHLEESWDVMQRIEQELEQSLTFAFSARYGYLTSCPTNVGTGLRASVMLHLPALVHEHKIGSVISAVGKVGIAVRGLYGEQSEAQGNLFQVSNQITLGRSEIEIVRQLHHIVTRVIEHEHATREKLIRTAPHKLRNDIGRAYGTLKYAEILTSKEATELLSMLLMGVDLQVLTDVSRACIADLLLEIQPAHLQKRCNKELTSEQRDIMRAALIRERLGAHHGEGHP